MDKGHKMEGDYNTQGWMMWLLWKESIKLSYIHCWLSAICRGTESTHSTVFNWVRSYNSGIATPLQNGSMKPTESPQGDGSDVYPRRGICWTGSCLVFTQKTVKLREMRWVHIISKCHSWQNT